MQLQKKLKKFFKKFFWEKHNSQTNLLDFLGENTEIHGFIDKRCHDSVIKIGKDLSQTDKQSNWIVFKK